LDIRIHSEYITLGQLLKIANIVSSGGEVKFFLEEQPVWVNGEREQRRGKKLYPSDVVRIDGITYEVRAE
jgi:ribosome-associated protein